MTLEQHAFALRCIDYLPLPCIGPKQRLAGQIFFFFFFVFYLILWRDGLPYSFVILGFVSAFKWLVGDGQGWRFGASSP